MDFLYFEFPLPGGCAKEEDFDVTRNLGAFKVGNFMEFTKIFQLQHVQKIFGVL